MANRSTFFRTTKAGIKYPAFPDRIEGLTDIQYYKMLQRTANKRLYNLEKLAMTEPEFESAIGYSYKKAEWGIKGIFGKDVYRFRDINPKNKAQLRLAIKTAEEFVNAPTSTKKGIKAVFRQTVQTINDEYDLNLKWEEWAELTTSGAWDDIKDKIGSKTSLYTMKYIKQGKSFEQALKQATKEGNEGELPDRNTYNELNKLIAKRKIWR